MDSPGVAFAPFLQDAVDRYAAQLMAAAVGPLNKQIASLRAWTIDGQVTRTITRADRANEVSW